MRKAALLGLTLAVLASACSLHPEDEVQKPESSVSLKTAQRRVVTAAADATRAAVGPSARLVTPSGEENPITVACSDFSAAPPGSPVNSQYQFTVRGTDLSQHGDYFNRFSAYLEPRGWTKSDVSDERLTAFERGPYAIAMSYTPETKVLAVTASTPCVKPD